MEAGALIGDALHGAVRGVPGEVVFVLQQQDNTNIVSTPKRQRITSRGNEAVMIVSSAAAARVP